MICAPLRELRDITLSLRLNGPDGPAFFRAALNMLWTLILIILYVNFYCDMVPNCPPPQSVATRQPVRVEKDGSVRAESNRVKARTKAKTNEKTGEKVSEKPVSPRKSA